jgi:hypothetical protein
VCGSHHGHRQEVAVHVHETELYVMCTVLHQIGQIGHSRIYKVPGNRYTKGSRSVRLDSQFTLTRVLKVVSCVHVPTEKDACGECIISANNSQNGRKPDFLPYFNQYVSFQYSAWFSANLRPYCMYSERDMRRVGSI